MLTANEDGACGHPKAPVEEGEPSALPTGEPTGLVPLGVRGPRVASGAVLKRDVTLILAFVLASDAEELERDGRFRPLEERILGQGDGSMAIFFYLLKFGIVLWYNVHSFGKKDAFAIAKARGVRTRGSDPGDKIDIKNDQEVVP